MRYLVTGGAGFIGSNFIRFLFNKYGDDARVVNLDKLTYAGIRENLAEYEGKPNYRFVHGDIAKAEDVAEAYKGVDGSGVDVVVNFAAETHVDRSLMGAHTFIETDVFGVLIERGENSETYNIGGGNERENREITFKILELLGKPETLIRRVADRQGHDRRYSLDTTRLERLGFKCDTDFDDALQRTVRWYREHEPWWRAIKERSEEYRAYYAKQYGAR